MLAYAPTTPTKTAENCSFSCAPRWCAKGWATRRLWKQAGGSAIRFAQTSMARGIGNEHDKLLTRNVEYHLLVTGHAGAVRRGHATWFGKACRPNRVRQMGYLKIGPAIEAMEAEAEGLGAAFLLDAHICPL